ncbi:endonuclease NucS domain-containing protein [Deefgea piscis]|uniref:endonuclease NucS domain-containing protein n=1 Tax=Deefgea piscis TaxID=2739061 RepID=UPI001C809109|nr:endonuclease NucS domain-containing protein [Deefgea piscis]QZA82563.1 endonuclease NucS [Deefgea piscis]
MKNYYRVMLGRNSMYAAECFAGNFIGANFGIHQDLQTKLSEDWREFNHAFVPQWLALNPSKSKVAAGLACGALWTVSKGIQNGDIVLCPDGQGTYRVGEVLSDYQYLAGEILPHRRAVRWFAEIPRTAMSDALRNSCGSIGTVSTISKYATELEALLSGHISPTLIATDPAVEDQTAFALEKHLEDFLVANWSQTELGKDYDIYTEDGETIGQQYPSDTGPMDILAISKDKKQLLVVELKKGRASDAVVGQVLRYMGFVMGELAEADQSVRGVIIALEDDQRIRRALAAVGNVDFYRYQISFKLQKSN